MNFPRFRSGSRPSPARRSVAAATAETLAMVLTDDAPVPDSDQDIHDLMLRLRGHLMQLGALAPERTGAVARAIDAAWAHEALVPESHAQALMPLSRFATAVRTVLWELRAEGTLCEHSPPCPPASASDHLSACVHNAHPAAGWSMLCNGLILFEDTGYLLPTGDVFGPRRPLLREAVTTA
ncbi:DUF5999 family protein [Streptomyces sp. NPDC059611]|uniref:DUF5999 family protein n=1 Tax=Streptomyces sp. NPDC059611 TaxID=3346884 RepID=UPI0036984494